MESIATFTTSRDRCALLCCASLGLFPLTASKSLCLKLVAQPADEKKDTESGRVKAVARKMDGNERMNICVYIVLLY